MGTGLGSTVCTPVCGLVVLRVQRRDGEQKKRGLGQAESGRSWVLLCSQACRAVE